jgi:hypothetical protein
MLEDLLENGMAVTVSLSGLLLLGDILCPKLMLNLGCVVEAHGFAPYETIKMITSTWSSLKIQ